MPYPFSPPGEKVRRGLRNGFLIGMNYQASSKLSPAHGRKDLFE
jgi:hypothetical protein